MKSDWIRGRHIVVANWRDVDHPQAGGAELYCIEVARKLSAMGARVTVITARSDSGDRSFAREGMRVVHMGGRFTVYPLVLRWLWRNRRGVDGVLDCQNGIPFFTPLAVCARVPVLLLVHHVHQEQFADHFGPWVSRVGRLAEGWASRTVYRRRAVVAVSPSTRSDVRRQLRLDGPVYVVPNGLLHHPEPGGLMRTAHPSITVVGRLVPQKRLELLLRAVRDLSGRWGDLTLDVVGDGPELPALRETAAAHGLGDRVCFHGRIPDEERDALLRRSWLTVNPSRREGWGLSVLEANRLGVPAVGFDVPGLRDAIRHGSTGWLVAPGATLAQTLHDALTTLSDPEAALVYSRAARSWATNFSWERTGERIAEVFSAEAGRLALGRAGRDASDLVAKVEMKGDAAGFERLAAGARAGDEWRLHGGRIFGLLYGADEEGAEHALERLNVAAASVTLASSIDLLGVVSPPVQGLAGATSQQSGPRAPRVEASDVRVEPLQPASNG